MKLKVIVEQSPPGWFVGSSSSPSDDGNAENAVVVCRSETQSEGCSEEVSEYIIHSVSSLRPFDL